MTKLVTVALALVACASSPPIRPTQANLQQQANITLGAMRARDSAIDPMLRGAYQYAVFPDNTGDGVLYERGRPIGYVRIDQPGTAPSAELVLLTGTLQVDRVFVMRSGKPAVEVAGRDQRIDYLGT